MWIQTQAWCEQASRSMAQRVWHMFLRVRREINLKRQKQILMMAMMAIIGCDPGSWRRPSLTRYARYVLFDPKIKILRCGDLKHLLFCKMAKTLRLYLAIHSDCLSMKLFACGVMVAPRMSVPDADCTLRWGLLWLRLFLLEESVSSGPVMFGKAMAVCGRRCWVIRAFGPCWVRLTLSHASGTFTPTYINAQLKVVGNAAVADVVVAASRDTTWQHWRVAVARMNVGGVTCNLDLALTR